MKKLICLVGMSLSMTLAGAVFAHGAKPQHGGIVATANDIQFELVDNHGKPLIYVQDHGKKMATDGATGKLTVLNGTKKTEFSLQAANGNALAANGEVKLVPGTKAVAAITFADKKTATVRFAVK